MASAASVLKLRADSGLLRNLTSEDLDVLLS